MAWAVMVEAPGAEVALAPNITDVFEPTGMANGLAGLEVTPAGRLASVIRTELAKLFAGFTERVSGWLTPPWGMVIEDEERTREKSAGVAGAGMAAD
jgi:hypothetical protein